METATTAPESSHASKGPWNELAAVTGLIALLAGSSPVRAQTDDFDSGSDAAWQKSSTADFPATFSFVADAFGGKAYRLQAGVPLSYETAGQVNMARAVAVLTNQTFSSNFYVAADLVGWETNVFNATNEAVIGLIARASNVTKPDQIEGVMLLTHFNQYDSGERGTAQIYAMLGGGSFLIPGAQGNFTIARGRNYRMVFTGTNNTFTGSFYDLEDLTRPLLTFVCDDTYAPGLFPSSGYSGLVGLGYRSSSAVNPTTSDVTFDNFVAAVFPPDSVAAPAVPHGKVGIPQVVKRVPASYATFYPAASGVTFNATSLTASNAIDAAAIRLFLNGVERSRELAITGPTTNVSVSFGGLASNCVYDARIELQDSRGLKTTNAWTFDTFSDAFLSSSAVKNIECEEYDFGGGNFIDDPIVSGYIVDGGPAVNVGQERAYADRVGVNANPAAGAVPPFDFFDWDTGQHNLENEFRVEAVGTQNGSLEYQAALAGTVVNWRGFDHLRQKYLAAQPDGTLVECGVERTEGGEWLQYTRVFHSTNACNVYLRHGCALTQVLSLDQIGPEPSTNNLGTFRVVNAFTRSNFRFTPLLDGLGQKTVVSLSGTNTLRLTMASPHIGAVKQGLWLNYLAFVPAEPQVYSSAQAGGPYTPEVNMLADTGSRRLIIPQNGSARFYGIGWTKQVRITGVSLTGGNVVLDYQ